MKVFDVVLRCVLVYIDSLDTVSREGLRSTTGGLIKLLEHSQINEKQKMIEMESN